MALIQKHLVILAGVLTLVHVSPAFARLWGGLKDTAIRHVEEYEYGPCLPVPGVPGRKMRVIPKSSHSLPSSTDRITNVGPGNCRRPQSESPAKMFVPDENKHRIFIAEVQDEMVLTSINASGSPKSVTYDSVSKKIYWLAQYGHKVYRADMNGENKELVFSPGKGLILALGIAIAENARTLYIASLIQRNGAKHKISSVSIAHGIRPGNETDFLLMKASGVTLLAVDEDQGYLYWTMDYTVARTFLNGSGSIEKIFHDERFRRFEGLSIDLTRPVRRVFFCTGSVYWPTWASFYKDVNSPIDPSSAEDMTKYLENGDEEWLHSIYYFNGIIYWLKNVKRGSEFRGIVIMKDYEHANRSYVIKEYEQFDYPAGIHITYT